MLAPLLLIGILCAIEFIGSKGTYEFLIQLHVNKYYARVSNVLLWDVSNNLILMRERRNEQ